MKEKVIEPVVFTIVGWVTIKVAEKVWEWLFEK
jgi:hypothetical protein